MIMEKCRNQDELVEQIYKVIETIENPEDKEVLSEVIYNIITPLVGANISDEMLEKINEKSKLKYIKIIDKKKEKWYNLRRVKKKEEKN